MEASLKRKIFSPDFWLRHARRVVILVVGGTVLLIGIAMIVLPGPAVVVIPAGLAILATEFAWARRLLKKAKEFVKKTTKKDGSKADAKPVGHS